MSFSAALAAIAVLGSSVIQDAPLTAEAGQTDPAPLGDVVVRGAPATREQLNAFVTEVGGGPPRRLMARWNTPICIGTVNARPEYAQPFIDHIAYVAVQIGASVDGPGCRANMLVIFTSDGQVTAENLAANNPTAFMPPGDHGPRLTNADLATFVSSDRPVRWWHLSQDVSEATGNPVQIVTVVTPPPESQEFDIPQVQVHRMSRLGSGMRTDLQQGVVIVDTSKLEDTSSASLADYTAMVLLSQIDPEAQSADLPSILSLFSDPPGAARLTEWDVAYLHSLYQSGNGRPTRRYQEREIGNRMQRQFDREAAR